MAVTLDAAPSLRSFGLDDDFVDEDAFEIAAIELEVGPITLEVVAGNLEMAAVHLMEVFPKLGVVIQLEVEAAAVKLVASGLELEVLDFNFETAAIDLAEVITVESEVSAVSHVSTTLDVEVLFNGPVVSVLELVPVELGSVPLLERCSLVDSVTLTSSFDSEEYSVDLETFSVITDMVADTDSGCAMRSSELSLSITITLKIK